MSVSTPTRISESIRPQLSSVLLWLSDKPEQDFVGQIHSVTQGGPGSLYKKWSCEQN